MDWLEITIETLPGTAEDVAAALTAGGFSDLVMEDQEEFQDFLEQNRAYWDYIDESLEQKLQGLSHIKLYLEQQDQAGLTRLGTLLETLRGKNPQWGALPMKAEAMAPVDWEESWKDNYPPQEVGEKLVVLPYWLAEGYADHRLPVILDPGLTFGTGAHPSTQMVMEFMEQMDLTGCECLDLGSGSGILSIAALRLGAAHATGVDIDPKAEDIARENAAYNGFTESEFTALTGNVTADRGLMEKLQKSQYRLVLVNIVADVIIALAPVLPRFLQEDSVLLLSGILDTRLEDVKAALDRAGLEVLQVAQKEDWRSIRAKRR
ncbi:MAG: 50S ribosomal protein L11 methyltransferase [Ruminococcaceae bacterium]|nr:50S ribosomal protein L11 methyltransferase [Oscillospiraceae bacterium]